MAKARAKAVHQLSGALPWSLPSERSVWKAMAAIARGPKRLCLLPAVTVRILVTASSLKGHAGKKATDRSKLDSAFYLSVA